MKINYIAILTACTLLVAACATSRKLTAHKPNIIFIYTDDQAAWSLGVYGNSQAHTPNIDKLAAQGAYMRNAFVTTPVCSPARTALLTGQYASEYGIQDFLPQPGHKLYDPKKTVGLDPSSVVFPEVLKTAGYTNGLIGKWHVGDWSGADKKHHPLNNGFDYFMGLTGGGTTAKDPILEKNGVVGKIPGFTYDILTDEAIAFIDRSKDNPFLLCLNYRAPHGPWLPVPSEDWETFEKMDPTIPNPDYPDLDIKRVKTRMKEYLASVAGVDRNVGKLLTSLKDLGLDQNTIIIYSSDHGYNMGHNGIEHKGNGNWITKTDHPATANIGENSRPNLYDNSLRVPAIVKWPGVVKPGTVISETVSSLDWYPTIVEMTGSKMPVSKILRGKSIVPLLKGKKVNNWDNDFYAEYSMIHYSRSYMRGYRTQEWKLIMDFLDPTRDELYHLSEDPQEAHNLINANTDITHKVITDLKTRIYEHMKVTGDTLRRVGGR